MSFIVGLKNQWTDGSYENLTIFEVTLHSCEHDTHICFMFVGIGVAVGISY